MFFIIRIRLVIVSSLIGHWKLLSFSLPLNKFFLLTILFPHLEFCWTSHWVTCLKQVLLYPWSSPCFLTLIFSGCCSTTFVCWSQFDHSRSQGKHQPTSRWRVSGSLFFGMATMLFLCCSAIVFITIVLPNLLGCGGSIKMTAFSNSTQKSNIGVGVGLVKIFQSSFVA